MILLFLEDFFKGKIKMECSLGEGTANEFVSNEFKKLNLNDKRLDKRAKSIFQILQQRLGSCIRRVFIEPTEARQAYDFF